jgi:hypothetical protein
VNVFSLRQEFLRLDHLVLILNLSEPKDLLAYANLMAAQLSMEEIERRVHLRFPPLVGKDQTCQARHDLDAVMDEFKHAVAQARS